MSILTEALPDTVTVDGKEYAIRTDYRVWLKFQKIIFDFSKDSIKKLTDAIINCIDTKRCSLLPENAGELMEAFMRFHSCGRELNAKNSGGSEDKARKVPIFDFEEDAGYIYGAFLAQYGIDLIDTVHLHWYKFDALFHSLEESNKIMKIMSWRDLDLSKIKDGEQRKAYQKLKDTFALPDTRTQEEKDADNAAEFSKMFF